MHYKLASLFGMNKKAEDIRALENMKAEIQKVGGLLHFTVAQHGDGWTAQCNEIEGIMTGGINPNPTDEEIETNIREAIHTAFHIPTATRQIAQGIYNTQEVQALYSRNPQTVTA